MSQHSRPQPGGYPEGGPGGETNIPIGGPGAAHGGSTGRLRRSASAEHRDSIPPPPPHHEVGVDVQHGGKPLRQGEGRSQAPAFVQNDQFFNEKITLPRLAVNEQEHITAEDYDNEDRGSLDNEEQSYDRTVRYSQARSGSLPARRWQERSSSYLDWGTSPRSRHYFEEGGGRRGQHYEHHELTTAPWSEEIEQKAAAAAHQHQQEQQYVRQNTQQTHERQHREQHDVHRNFHHRDHHYQHHYGGGGGGGGGYQYEEYHGGAVAPYYRPEHSSTLRREGAAGAAAAASSSRHQRHAASSSYAHRSGGQHLAHGQSFGRSSGYRAGGGGYYKERNYHKVNCCCFNFKWPPWGIEPAEPPRPMYGRP